MSRFVHTDADRNTYPIATMSDAHLTNFLAIAINELIARSSSSGLSEYAQELTGTQKVTSKSTAQLTSAILERIWPYLLEMFFRLLYDTGDHTNAINDLLGENSGNLANKLLSVLDAVNKALAREELRSDAVVSALYKTKNRMIAARSWNDITEDEDFYDEEDERPF